MEIAEAKQAVSDLRTAQPSFTGPDVARANTLIDNPDQLNQYFYGTCGMAAVVRSLLQHDRARFVQLLRAVYEGTDFNGITTGPGVLLKGRLKQRDAKATQPMEVPYGPLFDLDFVLTRSLGKLLKIRSPRMYEAQTLFSEEIVRLFNVTEPFLDAFTLDPEHIATLNAGKVDDDLAFDLRIKGWRLGQVAGFTVDPHTTSIETRTPGDHWVLRFDTGGRERVLRILRTAAGPLQVAVDVRGSESAFRDQGDLGLDSDGLKTLMLNVAGAPTATITRIAPSAPQTAVDVVNAQLAGVKPYVYALIRSFDDWTRANFDASARTFPASPTPPAPIWGRTEPEGEHIVAINGPIRKEADFYAVPVWTWKNAFEVRVPAAQLAGYVPILVHGRIGD
ncbi:hypothetical protein ACFVZM_01100 [Streptomyces sioyaensis]|uniref:hypothetical protein n=1 Tax=Streptomyces sioyaensis TaxID=67364 RepID=UPI0036CF221C